MNGPVLRLALAALVVMGATAGFLRHRRQVQKLGAPGLRLALDPLRDEASRAARTNAIALPLRAQGYESEPGPISELELTHLPADTGFGRRIYRDPVTGFQAQVSAVVMGGDRTSIHRPEQCLPWQGWSIVQNRTVPLRVRHGDREETLQVQRIDAQTARPSGTGATNHVHAVYVYWFVADGLMASTHAARHAQTMRELVFRGVLPRWSYVSLFTVCEAGEQDRAFDRLSHLAAVTVPQFQLSGAVAGSP
jgi:hypothetical protein